MIPPYPPSPGAINIFKGDRLVIFDIAIIFLNEAENTTAKASLISEKIKDEFGLEEAPTRTVTVSEQTLDYYQFGEAYSAFVRNWTRDS